MTIYDDVRERVSMRDAAEFLQLGQPRVEAQGTQWRYQCPACRGGDKRSLSINISDNKGFGCFVGAVGKHPKVKGNDATSLVAHVRGITQRDAAEMLHEHFCSASRSVPVSSPKPLTRTEESKGLAALDYLEAEHAVLDLLGISSASCRALGAGFAPRGTMIGRILIPLRLETGKLVGYLGIATKADQAPLLLFPKNLESMCLEEVEAEEPADEQPAPDELRKLFRVV